MLYKTSSKHSLMWGEENIYYFADNPWSCNCHNIKTIQEFLNKYSNLIEDIEYMKCTECDCALLYLDYKVPGVQKMPCLKHQRCLNTKFCNKINFSDGQPPYHLRNWAKSLELSLDFHKIKNWSNGMSFCVSLLTYCKMPS